MTEPQNNHRESAEVSRDIVDADCARFQASMPERIGAGEDLQADPHMLTCERCRSLVRELEYIARSCPSVNACRRRTPRRALDQHSVGDRARRSLKCRLRFLQSPGLGRSASQPTAGDRESPAANPAKVQRIVLTGFMGAGKTTVGRLLARRLSWRFLDADAEIESATGATIAQIFQERGEPWFREFEHETIRGLLASESLVLALGGGAIEDSRTPQPASDRRPHPASSISRPHWKPC